MEKVWSVSAILCLIAAFVFFWFHNFDGVFVTAVLGSVAWLLNYRASAKKRVSPIETNNEES